MDASEPRNLAPNLPPRLKQQLAWRWNRLLCMTPMEIGHRMLRSLRGRAQSTGLLGSRRVPAPEPRASRPWLAAPPGIDPAPILAAADRVAAGRLDVFELRDVDLGSSPEWNRDPKTGIRAPLSFGRLLDYRDPDLVGDIKYLWEPNRHAHLVTLAQAYVLSPARRYLDTITEHLQSWFAHCPYPLGPNWSSSLEAGLRLISWSATWQLLDAAKAPLADANGPLREKWLRSIYQHCEFIRGGFSLHSSANNHLIGEAAGLCIGALTWPCWPRSRDWASVAKRILEREAMRQNAPDGANREQSVFYHVFVLELLMLCWLAARANGQSFPPAYFARMEAMLDYLASIMDAGGNVPMFGDADDSRVLPLVPDRAFCPHRSLLATGALLFHRGDFKLKAGMLDDKTRWLLGAAAEAHFAELDEEKTRLPPRQAFPEGGYYILGAEFDAPGEIRVVADAGPLGYRSIAAHGHADALSFTLSARGRELLIDPGTYTYHTQAAWRRYFRGTSAHNTVRIDGLDQSEQGGNFLWLKKANAGCSLWLSSAEKDCFEGWHDGYLRLGDPVRHRRLIQLDKKARRVLVEDALDMADEHGVELFFHFHEGCTVCAVEGGFDVSRDGAALRLVLPAAAAEPRVEVHCGSLAPLAGWVSRRFDSRSPAPTIVWRARLGAPVVLRTEIFLR